MTPCGGEEWGWEAAVMPRLLSCGGLLAPPLPPALPPMAIWALAAWRAWCCSSCWILGSSISPGFCWSSWDSPPGGEAGTVVVEVKDSHLILKHRIRENS